MRGNSNILWTLGKIHEVFSYGLVATIACLTTRRTTATEIFSFALQPAGVPEYFLFYLFWTTFGLIPISVFCAFATKYGDGGEGLLFTSDSIVIIMFGHLFEDLLGIVGSPLWFLKDLFTHNWDSWKVLDYLIYLLLIAFIASGIVLLAIR